MNNQEFSSRRCVLWDTMRNLDYPNLLGHRRLLDCLDNGGSTVSYMYMYIVWRCCWPSLDNIFSVGTFISLFQVYFYTPMATLFLLVFLPLVWTQSTAWCQAPGGLKQLWHIWGQMLFLQINQRSIVFQYWNIGTYQYTRRYWYSSTEHIPYHMHASISVVAGISIDCNWGNRSNCMATQKEFALCLLGFMHQLDTEKMPI